MRGREGGGGGEGEGGGEGGREREGGREGERECSVQHFSESLNQRFKADNLKFL